MHDSMMHALHCSEKQRDMREKNFKRYTTYNTQVNIGNATINYDRGATCRTNLRHFARDACNGFRA